MCALKWIVCMVALFAADVHTGTLQTTGISPRRCHHCFVNATNNCEPGDQITVLCPIGEPYCATVAIAPNFISTVTCAAASESPCLLRFNLKSALELICTCTKPLCNLPYSTQLRNELLNFSTNIQSNASDELTEAFLKSSLFANVTKAKLYDMITSPGEAIVKPSFLSSQSTAIDLESIDVEEIKPRAESLKQATVPPDDEDDGEGSGLEDSKTPVSAPAAPSSFLPAQENNAPPLILNIYLVYALMYLQNL
ncbi:uncharacterized protein LOC116774076 [Danaus plexippus]|uniref:Uncharacterized protein n=1 Tax=Danaus plexippus plexippus TaxID=278856 RepID=A0A212EVG9_DANPL|nr:uncharacterized protein LOC116774076 [Danaus plexippus plexippus]XP_032522600.1 uncharacterized protein LOC116774076 [Danaus plexippus plexippus]XP_032522601.1 uncharacterized protein LOC116774076 [Danaus plexippus]OWR45483.1 hypothetical protein KGM_204988 [Danaus plexippus plexippus]